VPFGGDALIPVLSAEDLAIFKVIFDRPKDWLDLAEMVYALGRDFDARYALDWLRRILAPEEARLTRFEALIRSPNPASD
jgi:transposase